MNIIEFDGEIFINYSGLGTLGLTESLEKVHDELLNENPIYGKGLGHIFINQKVHVLDERRKFIKLGIKQELSFFKYLIAFRRHRSRLPRTNLHFTGFFRIEYLRNLAADYQKPGYRLTASNFSYLNNTKLQNKYDFELFSEDIDFKHKSTAYFLEKKNPLKISGLHQWVDDLYFPLSEISKRLPNGSGDIFELSNPEISFIDGSCSSDEHKTNNDLTKSGKSTTSGNNRNFPSTDALINQVCSLVSLIKNDLPDDYNHDFNIEAAKIKEHLRDDLKKDESIAHALQELNPDLKGLSYSSLSKVLAKKSNKK